MTNDQRLLELDADLISEVLLQWRAKWPQMGVMALFPEAEKEHVALLQSVFRQHEVDLCGAIFPALVTDAGFVTQGVWLLCFEAMPQHFLLADLPNQGSSALVTAARKLREELPGQELPTLFLVFDAMVPNISSLPGEVRLQMDPPVRYSGISAGSETFQPMPCLFDRNSLVGEGVLAFMLPKQARTVLNHGYPVSKRLMHATSSDGNRIDRIDKRNAMEVYQEVVLAEYGVTLTPDNFYDHAVHFPFGVVTAIDVLVRIPVAVQADGSLLCVGEVPPNSLLRLLRAPTLEASQCVTHIASAVHKPPGAKPLDSLLTFYCAGRRMHFGSDSVQELSLLKTASGAKKLCAALSLGEIDTMDDLDMPRFHNAALLCINADA
jgi:hypothetical protein